MTARRILVTGGAGFIGSHCCKLLASGGVEPVSYDNLSRGNRRAVRWGPLVEADICDTATLRETLRRYQPDAVIHFAALAYVGESVEQPALYYRNNVAGMLSLLEACRDAGVDRIVFSSSCATYGLPPHLPINEAAPQRPISPYGRSKLACEQMLQDYAAAYGSRYVALRYFNACGADPDGEIGEWHDPEPHLIPRALMAAAGTLPQLSVYGNDYDTPDGTCIRDYIHVCDLARAHVLALDYLHAGKQSIALNLGTGRGTSVKQILDEIAAVTGRPVPVVFEARRPGDPPALYADPSLARATLGFAAEQSDLAHIISTAAPFFGFERRRG